VAAVQNSEVVEATVHSEIWYGIRYSEANRGKVPLKFNGDDLFRIFISYSFLPFPHPYCALISFRSTSKSCLMVVELVR
jgi:hypothetical protein